MHTMMGEGVFVLPMHDSFIVRAGFQQFISIVMEDAYQQITAGRISVEADGPRLSEHFGLSAVEFEQGNQNANQDPSIRVVDLSKVGFEAMFESDNTLMSGYLGSWETWSRQ
jgi:hypothetical protein